MMERLALSVVMSARKLRPYFQSHTIVVLTSFPLRTIFHSPSQSGRLAKWAIELSEYDIEYQAKACAKSQVLADFLVELPAGCTTNQEHDLTCVEGEKARRIMEEVHSGSCKNHSSGRSLAVIIKRHGHYWPTMVKDSENFTQKCEKMLEARSHYPSTGQGSLVDLGTILVHAMVHGHSRTHAQVKTKTILAGFDGFLLKMGRRRLVRKH